jgi:hypothetical protein
MAMTGALHKNDSSDVRHLFFLKTSGLRFIACTASPSGSTFETTVRPGPVRHLSATGQKTVFQQDQPERRLLREYPGHSLNTRGVYRAQVKLRPVHGS